MGDRVAGARGARWGLAAEALPEVDGLVERMPETRGFPPDAGRELEPAEEEVVKEFLEARRVMRLVESREPVDHGDVGAAVAGYRTVYDHLSSR
jgi:hypothetical protein